jgi:hypothetical protein
MVDLDSRNILYGRQTKVKPKPPFKRFDTSDNFYVGERNKFE